MPKVIKGQDPKTHPRWKGGKYIDNKGYVYIFAPDHPRARSNGGKYIQEHRLVMEKHLKRRLKDNELVHHINGVKSDNKVKNLRLVTRHNHPTIHGEQKPCKECGAKKHYARVMCSRCYQRWWIKSKS